MRNNDKIFSKNELELIQTAVEKYLDGLQFDIRYYTTEDADNIKERWGTLLDKINKLMKGA